MIRMLSRRVLLVAVAALVGVAAALVSTGHSAGLGHAGAKAAYADVHCTRYDPSTQVDVYCGQSSTTDSVACTSSTALRDDNTIYLPGSSTYLTLLYFSDHCFGTSPSGATGYGDYLYDGAQSGYTYAACEYSAGTGLFGNCTTDWHN